MNGKAKHTPGQIMMLTAGVLLCLVVISIRLMGGLWAKYLTQDDARDQARVIRFGAVTITESTGSQYIITPGVGISKNPLLSFPASEATSVVFLTVDAVHWTADGNYGFKCGGSTGASLTWSVDNAQWTYLKTETDGKKVYYRVVEALEELDDIPLIKDSVIAVDDDLLRTELDTLSLTANLPKIVFEGIDMQVGGIGGTYASDAALAAAAWAKVSTH